MDLNLFFLLPTTRHPYKVLQDKSHHRRREIWPFRWGLWNTGISSGFYTNRHIWMKCNCSSSPGGIEYEDNHWDLSNKPGKSKEGRAASHAKWLGTATVCHLQLLWCMISMKLSSAWLIPLPIKIALYSIFAASLSQCEVCPFPIIKLIHTNNKSVPIAKDVYMEPVLKMIPPLAAHSSNNLGLYYCREVELIVCIIFATIFEKMS